MRTDNKLFILSNGRVAAIDKKSGDIVWEVKLREYVKGASLSYVVGQIVLEGDKLVVAVSGILLCLSAKDGSLIWKNELKGWGYAFVSIANAGAGDAALDQANAAAIAAAATIAAAT
ncbi:MAG TPA: PQQ-binding-like beta-propeller repeat protein [Niabella sp.]|nr:PQQ-binding-like beta-propeller repeat protein [Niabella sp.]